jgi:hypothetical protein
MRMKNKSIRLTIWVTFAVLIVALNYTFAAAQDQSATTEEKTATLIKSQEYVFTARTALPMKGSSRNLTSEYNLTVTPDSVISYLPYFGRAYTAPMDPTKGGIQFTSTDFGYRVDDLRKGGWRITIQPKDEKSVRQMILTVSEAGYGTLQVVSNHKQPISFYGVVGGR